MSGVPMDTNRCDDELQNNPVWVSEDGHIDCVVPPATEWRPALKMISRFVLFFRGTLNRKDIVPKIKNSTWRVREE